MIPLPELRTERLVLRVLPPAEAARYAAYLRKNRAHHAPWDPPRPEAFFTESLWQVELARVVEQARAGVGFRFALLPAADPDDGPVLGHCAVGNVVRGAFHAAHVGYALDRDAVGQGLMAEALEAVVGFCFGELGLHRVMANYMPHNVRSGRLLRRLGFVPEGYARDYLFIAGRWEDHVLTARVNPDWRAPA